jgi:hypothetical protein
MVSSAWKIIPIFLSAAIEKTVHFYTNNLYFEVGGVRSNAEAYPRVFHPLYLGVNVEANTLRKLARVMVRGKGQGLQCLQWVQRTWMSTTTSYKANPTSQSWSQLRIRPGDIGNLPSDTLTTIYLSSPDAWKVEIWEDLAVLIVVKSVRQWLKERSKLRERGCPSADVRSM